MRAGRFLHLALSFLLLVIFLLAGEGATRLLGGIIPGSVLGMMLLFAFLASGVVPERIAAPAADLLLSQLGMLFVPPAVGIVLYTDRIREEALPLLGGTVGSFLLVLVVTAWTAELLGRGEASHD